MPRKLKVFRTPIGFHDAYVAAPSQKAALEAWGADSNLFAQGVAEQVIDPELTKAPLEWPGEVVRVLRGTADEQVAALGKAGAEKEKGNGKKTLTPTFSRKRERGEKPSRGVLEAAEAAMEVVEKRQAAERAAIEREVAAIERRRKDMPRKHEAALDRACAAVEEERAQYEKALREWERG